MRWERSLKRVQERRVEIIVGSGRSRRHVKGLDKDSRTVVYKGGQGWGPPARGG